MSLSEAEIIELDFTDSTNNYAMRLIDGNKAQAGLTIVANGQTNGKGQRGKTWADIPGQSLLMSIIVVPRHALTEQFIFNAGIAVAIANVLQKCDDGMRVHIKWPNDMIVNDKKAGGILIENVLRGSNWTHSVIGLGLNLLQTKFPVDLPHATSLKIASGKEPDRRLLLQELRQAIYNAAAYPATATEVLSAYNKLLYKRGQKQGFTDNHKHWTATILHANADGTLAVQQDSGEITNYQHGQAIWDYNYKAD